MPQDIINRADSILIDLERKNTDRDNDSNSVSGGSEIALTNDNIKQFKFEDPVDAEIIKNLKDINLLKTTPIDALNILYKFQKRLCGSEEAIDE